MNEEFYQNSSWSKEEKEYFFYFLHQIEDDEKAYCLNEKSERLLSTKRKNALNGVIELTSEAIDAYPNKTEILRSYLLRAQALELQKKPKLADECYQKAMDWVNLISRDDLDALAMYVTFILRHRLKEHYDRALELADRISDNIYRLIVHDFVMLAARAIIAKRRGKKLYDPANEALKLVKIRKYKNSPDKTGLVDLEYYGFMIDELLKIAT